MTSLTQQFAAEYTKKAVAGMLRAIRVIKWANKGILVGAVAASYLHQAHFLLTLGAGFFAWIVPGVFDLAIVSMLTITQTVGMAADAKRAALKLLVVVVTISAAVNFAAPGPLGLRIIFALIVGLVAGVEWVAGKIRPDFAAIEVRETELTTRTVTDTTPAVTTTTSRPAPAPAAAPTPATAGSSGVIASDIPARLLPAARISAVQHRQTTGEHITAGELAARLSTTPAIAGKLLAAIGNPSQTPARINGTPVLTGGVR
jgi:ribose/xylose/arabinose/galactoside ABC-type transport system permease subunit